MLNEGADKIGAAGRLVELPIAVSFRPIWS
jgi:hypothetical protein